MTHPFGSAVEKTKPIEAHSPIVRQFEISDPVAKACWYKDGTQIYPKNDSQSETARQTVFLQSDGLSCEGRFGCERKDKVQFNVDKKGVPSTPYLLGNLSETIRYDSKAMSSLFVCFLGFVCAAYQCHSGDDSGAVSDESHQSTMDTKGEQIYFNIRIIHFNPVHTCH